MINVSEETIQNIINDKNFLSSVISMNKEEAKKAFAEKGLELTDEDLTKMAQQITEQIENPEKINEEYLETATGGTSKSEIILNISKSIAYIIVAGCAIKVSHDLNFHATKMSDDLNFHATKMSDDLNFHANDLKERISNGTLGRWIAPAPAPSSTKTAKDASTPKSTKSWWNPF